MADGMALMAPDQARHPSGMRALLRPWRQSWLLGSMLIAFVLTRVLAWVLSQPVGLWGDSPGYLPGPSVEVPADGVLYFGRLSLLGVDAIRPWTVTIPFALQPIMELRSFYQLLLSIAAFILLASALLAVTRVRWIASVLVAMTFLFACTNEVTGWDSEIGRESTSISLAVMMMAVAILAVARVSTARIVALLILGTLLAITRSSLMPLAVSLAVVPLAVWVNRVIRDRRSGERFVATKLALVGLLVLVMLVYPFIYSSNVDAGWEKWYGRTQTEAQMGYLVSDFNPQADRVIEALSRAEGAPSCLTAGLPVKTELPAKPWYFTRDNEKVCPGTIAWVNENWWSWYGSFVAANPTYAAALIASGIETAMAPANMVNHVAGAPQSLSALFFQTQVDPDQGVEDPSILWLAGCLVLVMVWTRLRSARVWRREGPLLVVVAAIVIGGIGSAAVNLMLVPASQLDTQRLSVAAALPVRWALAVAAVGLACAVAGTVAGRRRPRRLGPELQLRL